MEERLHQLICRTPFETGFNPFSVGDAVFLLLTLSVDFRLKKNPPFGLLKSHSSMLFGWLSWLRLGKATCTGATCKYMQHPHGAATFSMFGRKKFGELRQRAFVMHRRLQHLGNELGWPAGLFFDAFLSRMKLWIYDMQNRGGQSAWMQNNASSSTWKNIWTFFQVLKVCHKYPWTWPVLSIMSTKESDIDSNLLQLLFDTPTRRAALCEALSCEDLKKSHVGYGNDFTIYLYIYICIIYIEYLYRYVYIYMYIYTQFFFLLFSKFCNKEMQEEAVQPLAVWVPGSRLRYYIIENFITLRQAATGGVGVLYGARKARASGESSS